MSADEILRTFVATLRRYDSGDTPERVPLKRDPLPAAALLPRSFREWLVESPFERARFGGIDMVGSAEALQETISARKHAVPSAFVPFGWAEDMGSDLCFEVAGAELDDNAHVVAVDHEDGRRRPMGSFSELLEGWTFYMEHLMEQARRFQ